MQVRVVFSFTTEQTGQDPSGIADSGVLWLSALLSCVIETLLFSTPPFLRGVSCLARLGNCMIGSEDIDGAGDLDDEAREIDGLDLSIFL
jgi:hypothetical protein